MKIVLVNSVSNTGFTGRIAEGIASDISKINAQAYICFGRNSKPSVYAEEIKIGHFSDVYLQGLQYLLFDCHCFGSGPSTAGLLRSSTKSTRT